MDKIKFIWKQAFEELKKIETKNELNIFKIKYLGKKGQVTSLLQAIGTIHINKRPEFGKMLNNLRKELELYIRKLNSEIDKKEIQKKLKLEKIDVTLPGRQRYVGKIHPLTQTLNRIKNIFIKMGYSIADGPEIELDYFNFEMMNLPKSHPARDMQDTFYINDNIVLRTHTSPVQSRVMQSNKNNEPIKIITYGKVYRCDNDVTHSPVFHQVEGLFIDKNISLANLKGTLMLFLKEFFDDNINIRLRPSYFPFTEPSLEIDISCVLCTGLGCKICKGTGWLEILGAGMVHPQVLKLNGYSEAKVSGFAFGMGVERIAMLYYKINDVRLFYDNDIRFIRQF